jgi:hypothetical protein
MRRRKDNIKTNLLEVGCRALTGLICFMIRTCVRAIVNSVMNIQVPKNAGNF